MTTSSYLYRGRRGVGGRGPFIYAEYEDGHVICPGRASALKAFVRQAHGGLQHKLKNAHSSNSEDALTWSCFDALRYVDQRHRKVALTQVWELAFGDRAIPAGVENGEIEIGRVYGTTKEGTEVDVSIEGPGVLVFFEAKLYSSMSQSDYPRKPHNQIARKLRVGAREAVRRGVDFYFIVLDLAPIDKLRNLNPRAGLAAAQEAKTSGFGSKWLTAYWFVRYKYGWKGSLTPLRRILADAPAIDGISATQLGRNMGWLTWADVFKAVLRAVLANQSR
jgi:hypothetical protein